MAGQTGAVAAAWPAKRVIGYHGTTERNADLILADGFALSENSWDWLGRGVYFFEAAPSMALQWAVDYIRRKQLNDMPAVLSAEIDLSSSIDLLDDVWDDAIKEAAEKLERDGRCERQHGLRLRSTKSRKAVVVCDYEMPPDSNRRNHCDCQVINAVWGDAKDRGFTASSIRAPFVLGRQLFSNSYLFNESHVQIAVIDQACLRDIRRIA